MKMAKADEADLRMAMDLCTAFDAMDSGYMPADRRKSDEDDDPDLFDRYDLRDCARAIEYLLRVAGRGSLFRVVYGCAVMLDPANRCVDPDADTIEHHPATVAALDAKRPRTLDEWKEEDGPVLWWRFPLNEPPYVGDPHDDDWPGYHTHWTPLMGPDAPEAT